MIKKSIKLAVRVSPQERKQLDSEAAKRGVSLSDYIRHIISTYQALNING